MKKLIYSLFALSGMFLTAFSMNIKDAQASIPTSEMVLSENIRHNTEAIDFAGMMNAKDNVSLAYHYSHSSHYSHRSHSSHYSHYSSRY